MRGLYVVGKDMKPSWSFLACFYYDVVVAVC